jgi:hypothetical protein
LEGDLGTRVDCDKLNQQFVEWLRADFTVEKYQEFLDTRAERLADEANRYLSVLSNNLPEDCRPNLKLLEAIS